MFHPFHGGSCDDPPASLSFPCSVLSEAFVLCENFNKSMKPAYCVLLIAPNECCCRASWDDRSRSLVLLLSLLTGIIWAVGWMNIVAHCHWSRLLCGAAQLASASMVALQVCVQVTLTLAVLAVCLSGE